MSYVANPPIRRREPAPVPLAAVDTWRPVVEAAGFQCQCTGGCGKTHAKDPDHRCPKRHKPDCLLVASAATPTNNPHADMRGPLVAYCPDCYAGHKRAFNRAQKALEGPKEPLFGMDGEIPKEVAAPEPPPLELVAVPHDEGHSVEAAAQYVIAEAMRLTADGAPGRVKFRPGAKLAYWSLLAAGWTPPGDAGDDEAARLRKALEAIRRELDDLRASTAWAHEAEEKANAARGGMAVMLTRTVASLKELARVAAIEGRPEPTLPVTKVAASLEKALARDRR